MKTWKAAAYLPILLLASGVSAAGQAQTSNANYSVYQVGGDVMAPRVISAPIPPTPDTIRKNSKVRVSFVVTPDGSVANIRLVKSSETELDSFARSAVSKWKFAPATKAGKPVAVRLETEIKSHK